MSTKSVKAHILDKTKSYVFTSDRFKTYGNPIHKFY